MNLQECYVEEDLFPIIFTEYEERDYGILFYNTDNKDSYDSNHAVIYKDRIHDLRKVLADISGFYKMKGSWPIIYQSMLDDNWFEASSPQPDLRAGSKIRNTCFSPAIILSFPIPIYR